MNYKTYARLNRLNSEGAATYAHPQFCPPIYNHPHPTYIYDFGVAKRHKNTLDILDALTYAHMQIYALIPHTGFKDMPTKNTSSTMPDMIQFKLRKEELEDFDAWLIKQMPKFENLCQEAMLNGNKIGCSWDGHNDCFICSLTQKNERDKNEGKCLLSRSTDWREAVMLNFYKVIVVFGGGKWENRKEDDNRG